MLRNIFVFFAIICFISAYNLQSQPVIRDYQSINGLRIGLQFTTSNDRYYCVSSYLNIPNSKFGLNLFSIDKNSYNVVSENIIGVNDPQYDYELVPLDIQYAKIDGKDMVVVSGRIHSQYGDPYLRKGFILIAEDVNNSFSLINYCEIDQTKEISSISLVTNMQVPYIIAVGERNNNAYIGKFDFNLNNSYWHYEYDVDASNSKFNQVIRITDDALGGGSGDPNTFVAIGTGYTETTTDMMLIKVNLGGTTLIEKAFDNIEQSISQGDDGKSITFKEDLLDRSTYLYATGFTGNDTYPQFSQFNMKLDVYFNIIWEKKYPQTDCFVQDMNLGVMDPWRIIYKESANLNPNGILVSAGIKASHDLNCQCPDWMSTGNELGYIFRHDENTGNPIDLRILRSHPIISGVMDLEKSLTNPNGIMASQNENIMLEDDDIIFNSTGCSQQYNDIYTTENTNFNKFNISKTNVQVNVASRTPWYYTDAITFTPGCNFYCSDPKLAGLLKERDIYTLDAYPTVVENEITLNVDLEIDNLSIYSVEGEIVHANVVSKGDKVQVSDIATGTYFLVGEYKDKALVFKFIKK